MMICYLPYTTVWTYGMGSGGLQHGIHIPSGGVVRMFEMCIRDSNAVIRYTTDGSEPTESSIQWQTPVVCNAPLIKRCV